MKTFALIFAALFSAALFSCKKEEPPKNSADPFEIEVSEEKKSLASLPSWHPSEKKICVVFGYGYNDKHYVQAVLESLSAKYGLDDGSDEGGLIFALVYPDDFPMERISRLSSLIGERELAGLIVVGAPAKGAKSMFMLNEAVDILRQGKSVMYLDSELSSRLFLCRMVSHLTGIEFSRVRSGRYSEEENERIKEQLAWIKQQHFIHIYMPIFNKSEIYRILLSKIDKSAYIFRTA